MTLHFAFCLVQVLHDPYMSLLLANMRPHVQGVRRYLTDHAANAGSAHDDVCMRLFAAGLLAAGHKDEAAAVYYSLLQGGGDRAQQVRTPTPHFHCLCYVPAKVSVDAMDPMVKSHP